MKFELAYYDLAVQHFNHYAMRTLPAVFYMDIKNVFMNERKLKEKEKKKE